VVLGYKPRALAGSLGLRQAIGNGSFPVSDVELHRGLVEQALGVNAQMSSLSGLLHSGAGDATRARRTGGARRRSGSKHYRGGCLAAGMRVASAGEIAAKPRREQRCRPDWGSSPRRGTSGGEGRAGIGARPGPTAPQGPAAEHPVDPRPSAGRPCLPARPPGGRGASVSAGVPPLAGSFTATSTRSTAAGRRRLHPIEVAGAISQATASPGPGAGASPPCPRALL